MVSNTPKFIDFIGVDRFDSVVGFYLVNLYNYLKTNALFVSTLLFSGKWFIFRKAFSRKLSHFVERNEIITAANLFSFASRSY